MLSDEQLAIVEHAFRTFDRKGDGIVQLDELARVFDASKHPRVKEGNKAPSAARDLLVYQLGESSKQEGGITLDVFIKFHEKMAFEAESEHIGDKDQFLTKTIEGIWRLGDLLEPTYIRPVMPINSAPSGIYATQPMWLVWPAQDNTTGLCVLKGIRDVVRPTFSRGDLPPEMRGFFAYPAELAGHEVIQVPTQIAVQRWLDFVWEYAEGKHAAVEGIISVRVDLDVLPRFLQDLIREHDVVKELPSVRFVPLVKVTNPMYKRSSEEYGYGIPEEVKRVHNWKWRTYEGVVYGLAYHGRIGTFTKKYAGPGQSLAASGINI